MNEDQKLLLKISENLATNTEATKGIQTDISGIKDHLGKLNSKVATQEAAANATNATVELHTRMLKDIQEEKERARENRRKLAWLTIDKVVYVIIVAYIMTKIGLAN